MKFIPNWWFLEIITWSISFIWKTDRNQVSSLFQSFRLATSFKNPRFQFGYKIIKIVKVYLLSTPLAILSPSQLSTAALKSSLLMLFAWLQKWLVSTIYGLLKNLWFLLKNEFSKKSDDVCWEEKSELYWKEKQLWLET